MVLRNVFLKESIMPDFQFNTIQLGAPNHLNTSVFIWIWNADKIPPHIGISMAGKYFSLTYKECQLNKSVVAMLNKAKRSKIPLVWVEIDSKAFDNLTLNTNPVACFSRYQRAEVGGATCLTPIKDLFQKGNETQQLAHLLADFKQNNQLKAIFGLHLNEGYSGLPDYSPIDIQKRIEELMIKS